MKIKRILILLTALTSISFMTFSPLSISSDNYSVSAAASTYTYNDDYSTITYSISNGYALVSNVTLKDNSTKVFLPLSLSGYDIALGYKCFNNMDQLEEAKISSAKKINSYAFYKCNNIKEIFVGAEIINSYAFYNCTGLERAIFPGTQYADFNDTHITLNSYSFYNCTNLNYIGFGCRNDIIVKKNAFYGSSSLTNFNNFNASSDHSSFYLNEGAFNGTGIISNTNAVIPVSTMSANNGRYNVGDAKKLLGNTVVVSLFVNTSDTLAFTDTQKNSYNSNVVKCMNELESEAEKYSKSLSMQNIPVTVNYSGTRASVEANSDFVNNSQVLSACKSAYSFLSGCTNMTAVTNSIKSEYNASNVAYMVVLNSSGQDYSYSFKTSKEFSVIHNQGAYSYNDDYVWMHELLHLFGAMDLYEGKVQSAGYTKQFLSYDIMYHNLGSSVGCFTACNIGWTDTVLASDFNNIIRTDGNAITIDYD